MTTHLRSLAAGLLTGALATTVIAYISPRPTETAIGVVGVIGLFCLACIRAGEDDRNEPPSGASVVMP